MDWLRKLDRTLPLPQIRWIEHDAFAGQYLKPSTTPYEVYDLEIPGPSGVILISTTHNPTVEGEYKTILHEWRHHWQYFHGWSLGSRWYWDEDPDTYDAEIRRYFTSYPEEMDALLFELSLGHPLPHQEAWIDILGLSPGIFKRGAWR